MKYWIFFLVCLGMTQSAWAEFKDPMRPPAYALEKYRLMKIKNIRPVIDKKVTPKAKDTWVLNSILFSSQRQHAIINNQLVKKGEMIKGARLVLLKPEGVRLLAKGKYIDLRIHGAAVSSGSIKKSLTEKKI